MKISVSVLDVVGAKKEAAHGPHLKANVALLTKSEAEQLFKRIHGLRRPQRLTSLLPLPSTPTHAHSGDGIYESKKSYDPDDYLLVVWHADKTPVYQRLRVTEQNGQAIASAGWGTTQSSPANYRAWNVELPRGGQGKRAGTNTRTLAIVKLVPRMEFVLVSQTGYWHGNDGTHWDRFARGRMNYLWKQRTAKPPPKRDENDPDPPKDPLGGYWVTHFNCEEAARRTFVKAAGANEDWLLVAEVKTNKPRSFEEKERPADDIGVMDVYGYLDNVGMVAPGSVWEVSFFGHSHLGGPILFNTLEGEFKGKPERSPEDLDARPKDWSTPTRDKFGSLTAAHLYKAVWRIWGCNVDRFTQEAIRECERQLKPKFEKDVLFTYTYHRKKGPDDEVQKNQRTLGNLLWEIRLDIQSGYAYKVPRGVGQDVGCYAALPGSGTSMSGSTLCVTQNRRAMTGEAGGDTGDDLALRPFYAFYRRELGDSAIFFIDNCGFFEHRFLAKPLAEWPDPKFNFGRYRMQDIRKSKNGPSWQLRVASGAVVVSKEEPIVKLETAELVQGLVTANLRGWLFSGANTRIKGVGGSRPTIKLEEAADVDGAVYMQEDGSLFAMTRSAGGSKWSVDKRSIPRSGGSAITNGLLHKDKVIW